MHSRTASRLRYFVAGASVLLGTAWVVQEWRVHFDGERARALAASHTPRIVEFPGVEAWLVGLLENVAFRLPADQRQAFDALRVQNDDVANVPEPALTIATLMHRPAPVIAPSVTRRSAVPATATTPVESMRVVEQVRIGDDTLVLTRRRTLAKRATQEPEPEIEQAAAHLLAISKAWDTSAARDNTAPVRAAPVQSSLVAGSPPKLARFYAVFEDGSVLLLPVAGTSNDPLAEQTAQAWRRPLATSLASLDVLPRFDFGRMLSSQVHYTGLYPDVTGLGFVATVAVPARYGADGMKLYLAADFTVEIDLDQLIASADSDLHLRIAQVNDVLTTTTWKPWTTLANGLALDASLEMREEIREQAVLEDAIERRPLVWTKTAHGVLFAQQIAREKWLVGLAGTPPLPWLPLTVMPCILLGLLIWVERRNAFVVREHNAAWRHARRHDEAFELLQVPLVIVDPNDDAVVHANEIAMREFGLVPGRIVHEHLLATDSRSQKHYRDHQVPTGRRRAYGVRLRPETQGPQFALIRSVSLAHALPEFHALANHRLGLICPIENDADLAPVLADTLAGARQDERNKLATIIDHGVDVLARVLAVRLRSKNDDDHEFRSWLADYLFGRLHVISWILDHWGGPECSDIQCILGPEHLQTALTQYQTIFMWVAGDPHLRTQMHWNNGMLASSPAAEVMTTWIEWPGEFRLTTPAAGLFGYALGEILINAIKHGTPGTSLEIDVDLDHARRELCIRVRNSYVKNVDELREEKAYGGSAILSEIARICKWTISRTLTSDFFELLWIAPVTLAQPAGAMD